MNDVSSDSCVDMGNNSVAFMNDFGLNGYINKLLNIIELMVKDLSDVTDIPIETLMWDYNYHTDFNPIREVLIKKDQYDYSQDKTLVQSHLNKIKQVKYLEGE